MKLPTFILSFLFTFNLLGSGFTIIEYQSNLSIATPSLAQRQTCKMRLDNGLSVYLISDPQTPKTGAALAVKAGSWDDPESRPGMAHFVEHMLFLGTEKYPDEGEYHSFLDAHGGNHNACTLADRTAFFFSVDSAGFEGALDRFAQFFISPLFSPSGIARESEAVNQEFCKNLSVDFWRAFFVQKELANADHPFHNFCIGNRETLGDTSQEELQTWYRAHYRASDMVLVLYADKPLEELQENALEHFSAISNPLPLPSPEKTSILSAETAGKMVIISPRQQIQKLELTWELPPSLGNDIDTQPDMLVGHVLGHEGTSSLLADLKELQLAEELSCGKIPAGRDQALFSLSIDLTPQGVQNYEKVIERTFVALSSLRHSSVPKYIFDEVIRQKELQYTYQGREDIFQLVGQLALASLDEPLETFPQKSLMPTRFDASKIDQLLSLLTPEACHFTLIANPASAQKKMTHKEKWMNTPYSIFPIAKKKLSSWSLLSNTGSSL
ncbi:MAG: Protease 3, partial [Chlamydiae bacterium]|nr:Protease 3 [Chlamydiota bacterium]